MYLECASVPYQRVCVLSALAGTELTQFMRQSERIHYKPAALHPNDITEHADNQDTF